MFIVKKLASYALVVSLGWSTVDYTSSNRDILNSMGLQRAGIMKVERHMDQIVHYIQKDFSKLQRALG